MEIVKTQTQIHANRENTTPNSAKKTTKEENNFNGLRVFTFIVPVLNEN